MQIKIATRYQFTSVRMAKIKNNNKGMEKFGTLKYVAGGDLKMMQPLWKTVWRCLKKLKTEALYDPAIPLRGT